MSCQAITEKLTDLKAKGANFDEALTGRSLETCCDIQKEVHKLACEALYEVPDQVALRGYLANRSSLKYKIPYISAFKDGRARATSISGFQYFIDIYGNDIFKDSPHSSFVEGDFVENRARCNDSYGEYFIDEEGNKIGETYIKVEDYCEGCARVLIRHATGARFLEYLYSFINLGGEKITKREFTDAHESFSEGLVGVEDEQGWHYINTNGEVAIDGPFGGANEFKEGRALVLKDGAHYFIDIEGNIKSGPFGTANDYQNGLACVHVFTRGERRPVYIDLDGKVKIPNTLWNSYKEATDFNEGYAIVSNPSPYRRMSFYKYIGRSGKELSKNEYFKAQPFKNGYAAVAVEYKGNMEFLWSFIDKTGKRVTSNYFDEVGDFSKNGLARVQFSGHNFYINTKGEGPFEGTFDRASDFEDGVAKVEKDGKTYYIDSKGRYVMGEK